MSENMEIALLPLDARPCNTGFVRELILHAGGKAVLPEEHQMDRIRVPADFRESARFLEETLETCDAAVISLDHFLYGSLLASREPDVTEAEALERLSALRDILSRHPHRRVYLSSVLMRSSISALSRGDISVYQALDRYTCLMARYESKGREEDRRAVEEARREIPPYVLDGFLRVRARNLKLHLQAVSLVEEGLVSSLSILQEDCRLYGFQTRDQKSICSLAGSRMNTSVFLRNGADEGGMLLAMKAMWGDRAPLGVRIRWFGQKDFIAPYEDRPFSGNVESACRDIGICEDESSRIALCICCPEHGEARDAGEGHGHEAEDVNYFAGCAEEMDRLIASGHRVYLLDVVRANGGMTGLIPAMKRADDLWGYAAWNTASNALGTILAQILSDDMGNARNERFLNERLLDDLCYQGEVRDELQRQLTSRGEDVYHLREPGFAEDLLEKLMRARLPEIWPRRQLPDYTVSLPWRRTFEAEIRVNA